MTEEEKNNIINNPELDSNKNPEIIDENIDNYDFTEIEDIANDYELITSEEVEDYFKGKGECNL